MPSFDPYSLPPFWHGPSTGRYGQRTPLDSSISEDIKALAKSVNQFQAITKAQYLELGNRLSLLEKRDISPIISAETNEGVDNMDSDLEDTFALAPRSQEGNFLSHDEICSPVSSRRPQPSCALGGPPSSLGTKPVEGLVLNQSTWAKSESNLRLMSSVLGTAEHFMAAAGSLLKDKGDEFDELKSLLLQVDQSLGVSQLLLMGTLSNFTLSKRQEMLDKSPIPEPLKETLLFSPLVKDKLFGLPLGKLQEEVSKTPQIVKVDVQVSNEQRKVTTSQSHSETGPMKKGLGEPSGYRKRSATKNFSSTTGKKAKVVQGKKYSK
jgi:hypothetical protein